MDNVRLQLHRPLHPRARLGRSVHPALPQAARASSLGDRACDKLLRATVHRSLNLSGRSVARVFKNTALLL
eukprot:CAMPEP_0179229760 /NCGR_PEP_ID=MMETSP0797-20121207/10495_1 /TAXON_ID=47934 /ORGANISM="Dinophysis acuminata, Strain DAEP01" /LENGTH=70 /DNA_ID=CAMNT_0020936829 /DNA_START=133 /DNA_END=342 /DNA_ORIENTATION=-